MSSERYVGETMIGRVRLPDRSLLVDIKIIQLPRLSEQAPKTKKEK